MKKLLILLLAANFGLLLHGQGPKMLPENHSHEDASFVVFLQKLQYAIYKQDKSFLLSIVDPKIKNDFDGGDGIAEFKRKWNLDAPEESEIWFCLSKIISLGGVRGGYNSAEDFVFPYVFGLDLPENVDHYTALVVTGSNVNVRDKPSLDGKVMGQLSYEIVESGNYELHKSAGENPAILGPYEWYYVTTRDKRLSGYVHWDYVWSPIDYRVCFSKRDGKWKMVYLLVGD